MCFVAGAQRRNDAVDAASDGWIREQRHFVGQHELGDGEVLLGGDAKQFGGTGKGVRNYALARAAGVGELFGGENEAAADGVENVRRQCVAGGIRDREAHAVGVGVGVRIRVRLVA